jgi:hypothetical protein
MQEKMKLRQHRGSLAESLATEVEIYNTLHALSTYIARDLKQFGVSVEPEHVSVSFYAHDPRIPSDVYLVEVEGYGVYGFTNKPLQADSGAAHE